MLDDFLAGFGTALAITGIVIMIGTALIEPVVGIIIGAIFLVGTIGGAISIYLNKDRS